MKKFVVTAAVILLIIIVGIFFITAKEKTADITDKQTKVGLILNGRSKDNNWGQSHFEGLGKCAEELNLRILYRENVPEDSRCRDNIQELINEGCEIIICNSFGFGDWVVQMAEEYPDVYFFHASGVGEGDNLASYFGRIYQMRYLSGIVAGMQTESNEIGYVAAFPISEVNRGINAFTLGVKKVNPDATVYVEWTGSWTDDVMCGEAVDKLLAKHDIDVLAMHADSNKPLEMAEEKGIWSIGYNIDNSAQYPNTYLTAPVWEWQNFYEPQILACLQDKFHGKHYWEGVETGLVSLAPFTQNVKPEIAEVVEAEKEKLESGLFDVFYGPITDNKGKLRVAEGESMSDDSMLNEFDWYVEGVMSDEE
ncbi:MAG: BMP family ABC transporter substrate-binding protein [Lachnospiraceae bacterium]|nr:BMP family ABC transporter substrate-binding protein [Lachnospiraceae bacterium]